ncbi:hypothetical protein VNO80_23333 [Phaseolus coccineus]|uniref:Thioredoxin domain-containing protein n=1 Tax=Phaseolus coccineus TaxID=3886 RepID=A0AAN9QZK6_PHACN
MTSCSEPMIYKKHDYVFFNIFLIDCVRAEPVIYKKLEASYDDIALLRASVEDRQTWRNPKHPWRVEPRFMLTGVPTLIHWDNDTVKGRLEDYEAHLENKIETLVETHLAKKLHPDTNKDDPEAEKKFQWHMRCTLVVLVIYLELYCGSGVPPGTRPETCKRCKGAGVVREDPVFRREGSDIHVDAVLSITQYWFIILGKQIGVMA